MVGKYCGPTCFLSAGHVLRLKSNSRAYIINDFSHDFRALAGPSNSKDSPHGKAWESLDRRRKCVMTFKNEICTAIIFLQKRTLILKAFLLSSHSFLLLPNITLYSHAKNLYKPSITVKLISQSPSIISSTYNQITT